MHGDEKALDDVAPEMAPGEVVGGRDGEDLGRGPGRPRLGRTGGVARRVRLEDLEERRHFTPEQRLLLLDSWMRSRLPASEFGTLVDVTPTT